MNKREKFCVCHFAQKIEEFVIGTKVDTFQYYDYISIRESLAKMLKLPLDHWTHQSIKKIYLFKKKNYFLFSNINY